jgi:zinc protease
MEIGGLEMHDISWRQIDTIDEKLQSITSEQVQEVVKKYISDNQLTVGVLKPITLKKASSKLSLITCTSNGLITTSSLTFFMNI